MVSIQIKEFKESTQALLEQYPESPTPVLFLASLEIREKNYAEAKNILSRYLETHPDSLPVKLSLAQLQLITGNTKDAIRILESLGTLRHRPVLVATLVNLYEQQNDLENANRIFDESLSFWESQRVRLF
jgi:predicted Zn-dependent protease